MLSYVQILLFSLAVIAILAITDNAAARSYIEIKNGCFTVSSTRVCPPELNGYMPIGGPGDVFFIDPFGNITLPGQHQQQQQQIQQVVTPGKGKEPSKGTPGKTSPNQNIQKQTSPNQTSQGIIYNQNP